MKNELKVLGKQEFLGLEIPVIEGGFGENKKCVLLKTIAEIHNVDIKEVNKTVKNNIEEFDFGIDIVDLKTGDYQELVLEKGLLTKAQWGNSNNVYLLSEQGYLALSSLLRTPKAKEIRKQFRREYFVMREVINSDEQLKAMALLKAVEGSTTEERLNGITLYTNYKVEEAKKPLLEEIEHKDDVIIGLVDEISLAEKRQILNSVVKYKHANYRERWCLLYKQFEAKYHIDLQQRFDTYNEKNKPKCKNKVDYIDKVMNKIPELYEIAAKLFENDVKALVEEMYQIAS